MLMVTFSFSLLHLVLSSPLVQFLVPHDQRSSVEPNLLDEETNITWPSVDLRKLAMRLGDISGFGVESLCSRCVVLSLFARLIHRLWFGFPRIALDYWFEQFSASQMHFTEEPPIMTGVLACAMQVYGKADRRNDWTAHSRWSWYVAYKIHSIYHKW